MPRKLLALAFFCTAAFLCGFGGPTLVDRPVAPTQRLSPGDLRQMVEARTLPEVSAEALLVYDIDAGRMLYERDSDVARAPASLTKLMTALLVLEADNLDDVVTVEENDLIGDSSMGLAVDDQVTVETLLWGLLLPSGNDAAMALARHTSGSADNFVARMNERATQMGLAETTFQNPHGLDADNQVTSARDLLTLTLADLDYPLFREIVATAQISADGYALQNTNELLANDAGGISGTTGIKTGTTPLAGECLVAQIERDGHPMLIIVLGSSDRYADVRALHNLYQLNYRWTGGTTLPALNRLIEPPQATVDGAAISVTSGAISNATSITEAGGIDIASDPKLWYLRAEGEMPQTLARRWQGVPLYAYHEIERPAEGGPWQAGMNVGRLLWYVGDEVVGTQELVLR